MAPILAALAMDENLTTQFSWNDTRFEIGAADVILLSEPEWNMFIILSITVANVIGLPVNSYVMYWIRDRANPSLVDSMIYLDCIANIGVLLIILLTYPKQIWVNIPFCLFTQACKSFFITLNRVIPVTIAIYRYILVCQGRDTLNYHSSLGIKCLVVRF